MLKEHHNGRETELIRVEKRFKLLRLKNGTVRLPKLGERESHNGQENDASSCGQNK